MRDAAKIQPTGLKPGIYIDLDEDQYHADPALSFSSMKIINSGGNPFDQSFKKVDTDPMKKGKEMHLLLLQEDEFYEKYRVVPGDKYDPDKEPMRRDRWLEMKEAIGVLREQQTVDVMLSDGIAEASIVWEDPDTGLRFRSRHDYFKPAYTVDYKTADSIEDKKLQWKISDYGYDMQSWMYTEARSHLRMMLRDGKRCIHGASKEQKEIIKEFRQDDRNLFAFIFQMPKYPFSARIIKLDQWSMDNGRSRCNEAIYRACDNLEQHGFEHWPICTGQIEEFSMMYGSNPNGGE